MNHTFQTVHDLLQERWESDLPDKVIAALRPLNGKLLTARILPKLPDGHTWSLRKEFGMTHIQNYSYRSGDYKLGISLLVSHNLSCEPIDVEQIIKNNPAYFSARMERNHKRMEAMNRKDLLDDMARMMNEIEYLARNLKNATAHFNVFTEYGAAFDMDKYALEEACGLRQTENK